MIYRVIKYIGIAFVPLIILYILRFFNSSSSILFTQIFLASILSSTFLSLYLFVSHREDFLTYRRLCEIVIVFLFSYSLMTSTLLNIDRSRSFYVLSWVDKGLVSISQEGVDLSKVASNERLNVTAIEERLVEQESRGYVTLSNDKFDLTTQGEVFVKTVNMLSRVYRLHGWFKEGK